MRLPFTGTIRFDRHEFAGSFGDIGTDLPLIVGMIIACNLDAASALVMFGLMQIMTGLVYGIPMPVQPLKAMAVIMISQKLAGNLLYGAGLAIGITMLFLTATGLLGWLARMIPKSVVRGIQLGLGISLASLALKDYVRADGSLGYAIAAASFVMIVALRGSKKYPPSLFVILLGVLYAVFFKMDLMKLTGGFGITLPHVQVPALADILTGFLVLSLPQLPLSISNSVIATKQTVGDLFPSHPVSVRKIGLTYTLMNLINPFFGGIPTCHGAGGLAGHYAFGARTGGSVIIYGCLYLLIGLMFGRGFDEILKVFPLPILGVILLFEGLALMSFIKDIAEDRQDLFIALLVAMIAVGLPQGYITGLIAGTLLVYLNKWGKYGRSRNT
jgi:xanthine/uracil/vitamin C permease (AzgA family)